MKTITSSHLHGNTRFQSIRALWTIAMILWISVAANPTFGQTVTEKPHTISYQGTLMKSGAPVTSGAYKITVTLYSDEAGTQSVWSDEYNTEVKDGLFNILLGSAKTLPSGVDLDQLYLGVKINGTSELRPLTQIASASTSITVADNSITRDKLATDYVAGISINGKKVTGKGSILNIKDGSGIGLQYDENTHSLSLNSLSGIGNSNPQDNNEVSGFFHWAEQGNLNGNRDITPPNVFLGTQDAHDFEIHLNDAVARGWAGGPPATPTWPGGQPGAITRVFRLEQGLGNSPNVIIGFGAGAATGNAVNVANEGSSITGGGQNGSPNIINSNFGHIGGGVANTIDVIADFSTIGGGQGNTITSQVPGNPADEGTNWHTIGGGRNNTINIDIKGGALGTENGWMGAQTIGGGEGNTNAGPWGFIGGGQSNVISNAIPTVDDDLGDKMTWDVISGGKNNKITAASSTSVISGGQNNLIDGGTGLAPLQNMTISGGNLNHTSSEASVIGGGFLNVIDANSNSASIGAGNQNHIFGNCFASAIAGGGWGNQIGDNTGNVKAEQSFVGGGLYNTILTSASTIGGGYNNIIKDVSGLSNNHRLATIGGGSQNQTDGFAATVGGGGNNQAFSDWGTIPGGANDTTNLPAQLACGFSNAVRGAFPTTLWETNHATNPVGIGKRADDYNNPLLMVGNGQNNTGTPSRHNAFEVSYNGHSVVYDQNGTGLVATPGRASILGSTYRDNVINAWGTVAANGTITNDDNFAVAKVEYKGKGCYRIWLNIQDPSVIGGAGGQAILTNASITATIIYTDCPTVHIPGNAMSGTGDGNIISVSVINNMNDWNGMLRNYFDVYVCEYVIDNIVGSGYKLFKSAVDNAFMFKVVGRVVAQ